MDTTLECNLRQGFILGLFSEEVAQTFKNILSFAVPWNLFEEMEGNVPEKVS